MQVGAVYKIKKEFLNSPSIDKKLLYCRIDFIDGTGLIDVSFKSREDAKWKSIKNVQALYERSFEQFYDFLYLEKPWFEEKNRLKRIES